MFQSIYSGHFKIDVAKKAISLPFSKEPEASLYFKKRSNKWPITCVHKANHTRLCGQRRVL
jgi:hypothetical protein